MAMSVGAKRILVLLWLAMSSVHPAAAQQPAPSISETIAIEAGAFVMGSDRAEREHAYLLDKAAYGHSRTRDWKWYESEFDRQDKYLSAFRITRRLITNKEYGQFVRATGYAPPDVERETWDGYGLIHPYERTRRHAWKGGHPPADRLDHPVVLVSQADAAAYAEWLSRETGHRFRLPTEAELEKAMRGTDGRRFPWGDTFDSALLNSHDNGPFDTVPVGQFPKGASPFGLLDASGQVFEWTATAAGAGRYIVKGGSWDDSGCGICRPAARHARPGTLKHILIGFRLVLE